MTMEKLVIFAVCFVILALFMSVPQKPAGAYGQVEERDENRLPTESRPEIRCNEHETSEQSCQNLARNSIHNISSQIRVELNASYTYMAMGSYFSRDDVAYRGFAKFFFKASEEERDHAMKFVDYLVLRGGRVSFKTIHSPPKQEWTGPLEALDDALALERAVNDALLDLHNEAQQKNDPHLQDFIETEFLTEQVDSIKQLSDWRTIMTRLQTDPLGWHQFDQELFSGKRE